MKNILVLLLVFCFLIGCRNSQEIPEINVADVQSFQYEIVQHKENNPSKLSPDNINDKKIIEKIINWIRESKSDGVTNKVPVQSIPPDFVTIKLKNGTMYRVSPGNNDIVYFQIVDSNQTILLHSSNLNTWLRSGSIKALLSQSPLSGLPSTKGKTESENKTKA